MSDVSVISHPEANLDDEFCEIKGELYQRVLGRLHTVLKPASYLEVGTLHGATLRLSKCRSIAVDPKFGIASDVILDKPSCQFFQCTSDEFFKNYNATTLLNGPIELAFLDGMHLFEYLLRDFINTEKHCRQNSVVALHDCLPSDCWMAERVYTKEVKLKSKRPGWWTGDVWKCLKVFKTYRPDISVFAVDAAPTGLVLLTNLDPTSTVLEDNYQKIVTEFGGVRLQDYGVKRFQDECEIISTSDLATHEAISRRFWL